MNGITRASVVLAGSALLAVSSVADAQALFLARRAIGRIEQLSQSSPSLGTAYDTAAVIVEVAPDKVFATVKRLLSESSEVRVTRSDDLAQTIEFTDGAQIGGIQVHALGDELSQLLVSTARASGSTSATSTIVARILNLCRALNVVCQTTGS